MKIAQQDTAVAAFYEQIPPIALTQRETILGAMAPGRDYSMCELAQITGYLKSSISPCLNEMIKRGTVEYGPERKCRVSCITIRPVRRKAA